MNAVVQIINLRQTDSIPVLNRLGEYLKRDAVSERSILPKSDFAAVNYIRNHWAQLQLNPTNGQIPIDNNDVEQLMKQVATVARTCGLSAAQILANARRIS